jgi:tRNA(His) 5'-end guanylyltransferase
MAASEQYSHKQLMNKNGSDKLDMLMEKGVNWNDFPKFFKEGSFFKRQEYMKGEAVRTKVVETDTFEKFRDLTTEQKVEFIFAKKLGGEKK